MRALTDGSSRKDTQPQVVIDSSDEIDRWRYVCPNNHRNWVPTNNHCWCRECARAAEQGADVEPEFWHVVDKKTGEEIAWSRVELR